MPLYLDYLGDAYAVPIASGRDNLTDLDASHRQAPGKFLGWKSQVNVFAKPGQGYTKHAASELPQEPQVVRVEVANVVHAVLE
jgi:hypothetical protein